MKLRAHLLTTLGLLLFALRTPAQPATDDDDVVAYERSVLRGAGLPTNTAGLLAYFRDRAAAGADLGQVDRLVALLGGPRFEEREAASRKLAALGPAALPALRQAEKSPDAEVARRAKGCAAAVGRKMGSGAEGAAVRMLLRRHPRGMVAALLDFLPSAGDEAVVEEIWYGLYECGVRAGAVPEPLRAAVGDRRAACRALAACVLGRLGTEADRAAVRRLLGDAEPVVRLRAAQGLLAGGCKDGIPALVELLSEQELATAWQAEELLHWAAGGSAPGTVVGLGDKAGREKCQREWAAWWRERGPALDLTRPEYEGKTPYLALAAGPSMRAGGRQQIGLVGGNGRILWEFPRSMPLVDASLLPGNRLCLVEEPPPNHGVPPGFMVLRPEDTTPHGAEMNRLRDKKWSILKFGASSVETVDRPAHLAGDLREGDLPLPMRFTPHALYFHHGILTEVTRDSGVVLRTISAHKSVTPVKGWVARLANGRGLIAGRAEPTKELGLWELGSRGGIHWYLRGVECTHADSYRGEHLLVAARERGFGRLAVLDGRHEVVWEVICRSAPQWAGGCCRLVPLGFGNGPSQGEMATTIRTRLRGLDHADPFVRAQSCRLLAAMGPKAIETVPALWARLIDSDPGVQRAAIEALGGVGLWKMLGLCAASQFGPANERALAIADLHAYRGAADFLVPILSLAPNGKRRCWCVV